MKMDEKDALVLIEQMINNAKKELKDNGFYFLLWGWLVFIAAITNYYLLVFSDFEIHSLPWMILMPLGGVVTFVLSAREKKNTPRVKTYVDEILKHVITAFAISLLTICFFMPMGGQWKAFYPSIMVIYSIWLYISGGMLKFKPLVWGAFLNWILAAAGFIYASTPVHLLLIAFAVLGGFIIPGYLLKQKFNRNVQGA